MLRIPAGRVADHEGAPWLRGLRAIAHVHKGEFRLTPNQNLMISGVSAEQRQAMFKDLESQESGLKRIIADIGQVVDRLDRAGLSINTATAATVTTTEQASRRTLDRAFLLAAAFALLLLVGLPISFLSYRFFAKRMGVAKEIQQN